MGVGFSVRETFCHSLGVGEKKIQITRINFLGRKLKDLERVCKDEWAKTLAEIWANLVTNYKNISTKSCFG